MSTFPKDNNIHLFNYILGTRGCCKHCKRGYRPNRLKKHENGCPGNSKNDVRMIFVEAEFLFWHQFLFICYSLFPGTTKLRKITIDSGVWDIRQFVYLIEQIPHLTTIHLVASQSHL